MRALLKLAGIALLAVGVLQGVVWYMASRQFAQTARDLAPAVELSYGSSFAWLTGDLGLRDVRVRSPVFGDGEIAAQEVRMELSGPIEMVSLMFADDHLPDDIALNVRRMRLSTSLEQSLRESASRWGYLAPFEALGCNERGRFAGTDYADLGWMQADSDVRYVTRRNDDGTSVSFTYDMAPLGRLAAQMDLRGEAHEVWRTATAGASLPVEKVEISYQDRGMMTARNRYCAENLNLGEADFIQQHQAAFEREIESQGMFLDPEVIEVYRKFAAEGGTLSMVFMPSANTPLNDYRHYSASDRLQLLNAAVRLDEAVWVPVRARFYSDGVDVASVASPASPSQVVRVQVDPTAADALTFEELSSLEGQRISVKTREGQTYVGTVLGTQGPLLRLEIVQHSGRSQRLALSRSTIVAMSLAQ